ncbi:dienelactone hydrolase [Rhizomicrobium palustre]|uniref:Dienelactone hydrolase n=1 Tax=Rhizomicrobium palustre TaxID=189966 RepID=A0A846MWL9_9PROT|nr:alpha/beta hydrolase [Rhizomicrobium palustre]NIK87948.1 dienelactone hydrolase [Rhizomicrobium palustre]
MLRRIVIGLFALALSGCAFELPRDSVVLTNKVVEAQKIKLGDKPTKEASLGAGYRYSVDNVPASFGTLHTMLVESDAQKPLIVFCGGNLFREEGVGGYTAEALTPFGDVLFYDYPGYGTSGGDGTRADFAEAERVMKTKVEALALSRPSVIFWGHSLGGGICSSLAAHTNVKSALVLAGTFGSYEDIKDDMLGLASGLVTMKPAEDLITYEAPVLLKDYSGPIVVLALTEDETIPYGVSKTLAKKLEAEGKKVVFVTLKGKGHSRIHSHPDFRAKMTEGFKSAGVAIAP